MRSDESCAKMSLLPQLRDFRHEFGRTVVHVRNAFIVVGDPIWDINYLLAWYPKRDYVICRPRRQDDDHACAPVEEELCFTENPCDHAVLLESTRIDEVLRPEVTYLEDERHVPKASYQPPGRCRGRVYRTANHDIRTRHAALF